MIGSPLGPRVTMTLFRGRATNPEERVSLRFDGEPRRTQEPQGSRHLSASSFIRTFNRVEQEEEARKTGPAKGGLPFCEFGAPLLSQRSAGLCELSAAFTQI